LAGKRCSGICRPPSGCAHASISSRLRREPAFKKGGIAWIVEHDTKYAALTRQRDALEVREYALVLQPCPNFRKEVSERSLRRTLDAHSGCLPGRRHDCHSLLFRRSLMALRRGKKGRKLLRRLITDRPIASETSQP